MEIYISRITDISNSVIHDLCSLIDDSQSERIMSFIDRKDAIRTLVGDLLIRSIFTEKHDMKKENIIFRRNAYGKPFIISNFDFHYNLSHSGDYVVCAIDDSPIGIDIEEIRNLEHELLSRNYFSESEYNFIKNDDDYVALNNFYTIWTLKESYVKCEGDGLSIPLDSFSIEIDKISNVKIYKNNQRLNAWLKLFSLESDYKMAVCSFHKKISDTIINIDMEYLISQFLSHNNLR